MSHMASGVIALLAIVSSIFFASRKKAVTVEPQKTASETKPSDVTGRPRLTKYNPHLTLRLRSLAVRIPLHSKCHQSRMPTPQKRLRRVCRKLVDYPSRCCRRASEAAC